jgi:hypothetical protein
VVANSACDCGSDRPDEGDHAPQPVDGGGERGCIVFQASLAAVSKSMGEIVRTLAEVSGELPGYETTLGGPIGETQRGADSGRSSAVSAIPVRTLVCTLLL